MTHAKPKDLRAVLAAFQAHKDVFPHIRQDALLRRIDAGQCIYEDGVVITYQQYKKRTRVGNLDVPRGAVMLHQIVNSHQFSGAGGRVFDRFLMSVVVPSGGDLYLTVREENMVARDFYERHGMTVAGRVMWKRGTLPGLIYEKEGHPE